MWKFAGLLRCEKFQAYLGVKISGLIFSSVKFFNPPYLAQFQPNLHVKILAWSHVKISGLKQVWFTCENRCDRFGTGMFSEVFSVKRYHFVRPNKNNHHTNNYSQIINTVKPLGNGCLRHLNYVYVIKCFRLNSVDIILQACRTKNHISLREPHIATFYHTNF